MKYRNFRIAWSVAWGVVALLFVVLWIRSYWVGEFAYFQYTRGVIMGAAVTGDLFVSAWGYDVTAIVLEFEHMRIDAGAEYGGYSDGQPHAPIWVLTLILGSTAIAPWLRWRFSLRTLLIATTLVAVVLGLIVWTSR